MMVKRLLGCVVVSAMLFGPVTARAEDIEGTILLPNPVAVGFGYGLTEAGSACNPSGPTQGLDGYWLALDDQTQVTVTPTTNAEGSDLSVWFYSADCAYLSGHDAQGVIPATDEPGAVPALGAGESGSIPTDAAYLIVDLTVGANVGFTIALS